MQRPVLIPRTTHSLAMIVMAAAGLIANVAGAEQGTGEAKPVIPLIVMDQVPLIDAIKNLAAQAGINYIISPGLLKASSAGADSDPRRRIEVTVRWENHTAMEALTQLLFMHHLVLINDPKTTVAGIRTQEGSREDDRRGGTMTKSSLLTADTNAVIPKLIMDEVPLEQALLSLARQAGFKAALDPRLTEHQAGDRTALPVVSFRWENLTARQALVAVLDNYDLDFVPGGPNEAAQITARRWAEARPEPSQPGRSPEK